MNHWIEQLNSLADAWTALLWRAAWQGGIALAGVWLICRLLPRIPPPIRYALWGAAFLKLLIAVAPVGSIELPLLRPVNEAPVIRAAETFQETPPFAPALILAQPAPAPEAPRPSLHAILLLLWLTGVLLIAGQMARDRRAAGQLMRRCRLVQDRAVLAHFAQLCTELDIRRKVPLLVAEGIASPLLVGILRPAVILPAQLANIPAGRLRPMLAHELAHLCRHDLLLNFLPSLAQVLFFFHPLVWLAAREWRLAQESLCDRAAVAAGGCDVVEYAEMLLGIAASSARRSPGIDSGAVIAVLESRKSLERRLNAMRYFTLWPRRLSRQVVILLILALTALIVPWRVVAQEKKTAAQNADPPRPTSTVSGPVREGEDEGGGRGEQIMQFRAHLTSAVADLSSPVDTTVREVIAKEGARVKKGQTLFRLDSRRAELALADAEAQYKLARAKAERLKALQRNQGVAALELENALAEMELARNTLEARQQDLQETRVLAPFDGTVGEIPIRTGQSIQRGTRLTQVVEAGPPAVEVLLPDKYHARVKVGTRITLKAPLVPDQNFPGQVSFVAPTLDAGAAVMRIKATVEDPKQQLKPGMTGSVTIEIEP